MRIVVSDTSCMIDLRKAGLLEPLLRLPHSFVMPDALVEDERLCLSQNDKQMLRDLGLDVRTLPSQLVERAARHFNQHARLKLNDCFALVLAEEIDDCILLTGVCPKNSFWGSERAAAVKFEPSLVGGCRGKWRSISAIRG